VELLDENAIETEETVKIYLDLLNGRLSQRDGRAKLQALCPAGLTLGTWK
jgi:hypothetical protein